MSAVNAEFSSSEGLGLPSRRAVVFRPSTSEALANGATAVVDVRMVDGNGTTITADDASSVTVAITGGTGVVLTPQPQTFDNGLLQTSVRKDAPGTITLSLSGLVVVGPEEPGISIDTSATKLLTG